MGATMRITWLLLSLSFLHSVCSSGQNATSANPVTSVVPIGDDTSKTVSTPPKTDTTTSSTTGTPPTPDKPANAPTNAGSTDVVTTSAITVTTPHKSTNQPTSVNPPASLTTSSGATTTVKIDASPTAATPGQISTVPAATATADSGGSSVGLTSTATLQTSETSVPSKTSRTAGLPGIHDKMNKVSSNSPTPGPQFTTHTTITSNIDQGGSKGGTLKTTVAVTSHKQTASKAPEPAGSTGTTSTPSTLTESGPPAAKTSGTKAGTTSPQIITTTTTTADQPKTFLYSLNNGHAKEEEKDLLEVCRRLMGNLQDGNCTLTWRQHNDKIQFDYVEINGKVKTSLAAQYYEEITKKPTDNKTLIAILASCGALLIMIVILAVCASHHRKPYNENQQHLTEELHTVENGYHDNPTLEVMEVQPEMQEKKMTLNGEFNDSWIVPIDNLLKEEIPDEEDTHL